MKPDNKAGGPWLYALGLVPVIWFALLIAPAISGGLSEIVSALPAAMNNPFKIVWCEDSVKTVLIFVAAYGLGIGIYLSSRRNYRRGEEHGSARWGDPRAVNKKYRDKDPIKNRIFTQHVRMGLDGRKHRRNLNTLVVGGSGAGKSRFYAKVNICQCNTSFFILDCKGELLRDCGGLLERMGYEIKVVDLLNMEKSHCYNPFAYEDGDEPVQSHYPEREPVQRPFLGYGGQYAPHGAGVLSVVRSAGGREEFPHDYGDAPSRGGAGG